MRFPYLHQQDGTANHICALLCIFIRFKQNSQASGQTNPRSRNGMWRPVLAATPNEGARRITVSHHLAPPAVMTGTIPGPPKTSFIIVQARVLFLPRKVTTIPDLSNICELYEPSRVDRGRRDVGLSDFPDDNPMRARCRGPAFGTPLSPGH